MAIDKIEFATELWARATVEMWAVAKSRFGLDQTAETAEKLNFACSVIEALNAEGKGEQAAFDPTLCDQAEELGKQFLELAMVGIALKAAEECLLDLKPDDSRRFSFSALQLLGHARRGTKDDAATMLKDLMSDRMRKAANARHDKESRPFQKEARAYWLSSINRTLAAEKAAELLHQQYSRDREVRTYAKWISQWKKDLLRAG